MSVLISVSVYLNLVSMFSIAGSVYKVTNLFMYNAELDKICMYCISLNTALRTL